MEISNKFKLTLIALGLMIGAGLPVSKAVHSEENSSAALQAYLDSLSPTKGDKEKCDKDTVFCAVAFPWITQQSEKIQQTFVVNPASLLSVTGLPAPIANALTERQSILPTFVGLGANQSPTQDQTIVATDHGPELNHGPESDAAATQRLVLGSLMGGSGQTGVDPGEGGNLSLSTNHLGGPRGTYFSAGEPDTWTTDGKPSTEPATGNIPFPIPQGEQGGQSGTGTNKSSDGVIRSISSFDLSPQEVKDFNDSAREKTIGDRFWGWVESWSGAVPVREQYRAYDSNGNKQIPYDPSSPIKNDQDPNSASNGPAPIPTWMVNQVQNLTAVKSFELKHPGVSDPSQANNAYKDSEDPNNQRGVITLSDAQKRQVSTAKGQAQFRNRYVGADNNPTGENPLFFNTTGPRGCGGPGSKVCSGQ